MRGAAEYGAERAGRAALAGAVAHAEHERAAALGVLDRARGGAHAAPPDLDDDVGVRE